MKALARSQAMQCVQYKHAPVTAPTESSAASCRVSLLDLGGMVARKWEEAQQEFSNGLHRILAVCIAGYIIEYFDCELVRNTNAKWSALEVEGLSVCLIVADGTAGVN